MHSGNNYCIPLGHGTICTFVQTLLRFLSYRRGWVRNYKPHASLPRIGNVHTFIVQLAVIVLRCHVLLLLEYEILDMYAIGFISQCECKLCNTIQLLCRHALSICSNTNLCAIQVLNFLVRVHIEWLCFIWPIVN